MVVCLKVPLPNDGHTTNNDGNEIQIDLSSPLAQAKAKRLIAEMQEWISEKIELENYSLESIKFQVGNYEGWPWNQMKNKSQ